MDAIAHKVKNILTNYFAEDEIKLDNEPNGRVSGFIVSKKFLGMDDLKRQVLISGLLRNNISKQERERILGFFPFTPEEYRAYRAPSLLLAFKDDLDDQVRHRARGNGNKDSTVFKRKIKSIMTEHFQPTMLELEQHDEFRLHGFIASAKFEGQGDLARQTQIWKVLRKNLTKAEQRKILGFLAYTPGEYEAYNEPIETSA